MGMEYLAWLGELAGSSLQVGELATVHGAGASRRATAVDA